MTSVCWSASPSPQHPARQRYPGRDQNQGPARHQRTRRHPARRGPAHRPDSDGPDPVAVPAARCPRRVGHDDQRAQHQPTFRLAGHPRADVLRHPTPVAQRGAGCRALRADPEFPRCPVAQPARQRREGHQRARQTNGPDRRPGPRYQRPLDTVAHASAALDEITTSISAVSQQLKQFIAANRQQLKPTLDKLNDVLALVDTRKERIQKAIQGTEELLDGHGRDSRFGTLLQGLRDQPAAGSVRSAIRRCRPSPTSGWIRHDAALATGRSADRPAWNPCSPCPTRAPAKAATPDDVAGRHHR